MDPLEFRQKILQDRINRGEGREMDGSNKHQKALAQLLQNRAADAQVEALEQAPELERLKYGAELAKIQGAGHEKDFSNALDLKTKFQGADPVKMFGPAKAAFEAAADSYQRGVLDPVHQLNIIKAIAKMTDPSTGVQQGEVDAIQASQSVPNWIKGALQQVSVGGSLKKETVDKLMEVGKTRYDNSLAEYEASLKGYGGLGSDFGVSTKRLDAYEGRKKGDELMGGSETRVKDGVTYRRVPGGWEAVE